MSEHDEWGPWVEHDGQGCPVEGRVVHVVMGADGDFDPEICGEWQPGWHPINGREAVGVARGFGSWLWAEGWFPVIRYRVRKPRALAQLRDLVENLPAPARTPEPVE